MKKKKSLMPYLLLIFVYAVLKMQILALKKENQTLKRIID